MTQTIRILIIDDERYAREELTYLLGKLPNIQVVGEADRGETAILQAIQHQPDVVFLDVEMPNMNGVEVAKALLKLKQVPQIIFATAYPQFAVEAFRINAIDYLLKPYEMDQIVQAMERVRNIVHPQGPEEVSSNVRKLAIERDGEFDYITVEDIIYLHTEGKMTRIYTENQQYNVRMTMKNLEQQLNKYHFFRVHRSYLVNLNAVVRLTPWFNGAYQLELKNVQEKIPVSRNYAKELQQQLTL